MLCLDPRLRFRKAETNIYSYDIDLSSGQIVRQRVLHPLQAVILSLFDGRRKTSDIAKIVSQITNRSTAKCEEFVSAAVTELSDLLVPNCINDQCNPVDFVMPESQIDMSGFRLRSPLQLVLLYTYNCNSRCLYCYANRDSSEDVNEMSLDLAKTIVDQAKDCGVELIYLGGGDPFYRKTVVDLVHYVVDNGIGLILSTKEFLSQRQCMALADVGVRHMQVSVDTLVAGTGHLLTGRRDFVRGALRTIANLQSVDIEVSTNTVITGYNYRDVPGLVRYLLSRGITNIVLSRYYRSTFRHRDELFVDDESLVWLKQQLDVIDKPEGCSVPCPQPQKSDGNSEERLVQFLNRAACAFGRVGIVITPSGKVVPCEQLPTKAPYVLGDLATDTLQKVWESQKLISMAYPERSCFKGTMCYDCEHFDPCIHSKGWCIRDVYKVHKSCFGVQPGCPRSTHTMRLT